MALECREPAAIRSRFASASRDADRMSAVPKGQLPPIPHSFGDGDSPVNPRALTVGKRIRRLRLAKGWTQRKFAAEIGASCHTISNWESGAFLPALAKRKRPAQKLGTTIEVLFLDRCEQIAAARDKAMKKSLTILDNQDSSPAAFNAATSAVARAEAPEEKTADAREEFFRKLARLRGEER